jgi:hypothetical protein
MSVEVLWLSIRLGREISVSTPDRTKAWTVLQRTPRAVIRSIDPHTTASLPDGALESSAGR